VQFVQLIISGAAQGCIYGLIALGFVLIYKATETVSFAQGDLMMLGAFAGLAAMTGSLTLERVPAAAAAAAAAPAGALA
jgi:branched-chain amino acid transport system permease protein